MRKRILSILALLLTVTQGAWAQTTTYTSYTVTDGSVGYWPSADHDKLLDNNTGTKWCTVFGDGSTATATCGEWVEFNTPHAIIPTGYILTTAEDTDYHYGRNPKSWTLKGKLNVGDAWTVLTDVTNASMPKANHTNVNFDISNTDRAYKYFRFEVNAIDGSTYGQEEGPHAYKFQLSRLLLKGTDAMFDASFATGSGGTGWSISPTSATDGTTVSVSYTGQHRVKSVKAKKKVEAKTLAEVTAGDIGKIVGKDGKIYATKADAEAVATGNAVAMIAYVGSETGVAGYTHGLALALTDESSSGMYWNDAKTACTNKNTSATVESASWMLPSKDQWNKMIDACKNVLGDNNDSRDLRDGFTSVGGSNMESKDYWSSTEYENDSNEAWMFNFGYDCWYDYPKAEEAYPQVRACLAFTVEPAAPASTTLNNTMTAWTAGTYAVPAGGLTYSDAITVSGDVTLTLTDGQTLTLNNGISLAEGATLTIQGNGTMNINGTDGNTSSTVGGNHGTLILTSGTLTATGGNGGSVDVVETDAHGGNGGVAINGSVIVSGGSLTARGGNGGSVDFQCTNCSGGNGGDAISGSVTVSGGTLTATGGNGGSVGELGSDCSGGNGGDAISGTLTKNGGSTSVNDGSNGSIGNMSDNCTAGTGGKGKAGSGGDIPNSDPYTPGGDPFSF